MSDVRALLKQARQTRRISHPYAKYSSQGALYCTACTQKIASEALWESHISSQHHKEKVKDVIRASQAKAKRGIAATMIAEEDEELEQDNRKRLRTEEMQPEPEPAIEVSIVDDIKPETSGNDPLPADFFDPGKKPQKVGVDEDEWRKFQADIADTVRNQEEEVKEEEEESKRVIVEEFDEMNDLEDRIERLKRRRAELQNVMKDVKLSGGVSASAAQEEDDDDDEVQEEWW
jgi:hypothetical protein